MKPKVTLVSWTPDPVEVVWILWEASKKDGPVPLTTEEVKRTVPRETAEKLFWDVIRQRIPVGENLHFTFMLENVAVSFREQMVRHRIGTHVGPNMGVDIVPDLASSSWWSQSMRIQDMGTFADRRMYRVPETVYAHSGAVNSAGETALGVFRNTMERIQEAYNQLVVAGIPMEDARELIPLGAQHRISWDLNLQSLMHVVGKRGCWILQGDIWGPIIQGMVDELAAKVHPMMRRIIAPPCVKDDKFNSCEYRLENARRMTQDDQHAPCPLWLCRDEDGRRALGALADEEPALAATALPRLVRETLINSDNLVPRHREMKERAKQYEALWGRDPYIWGAPKAASEG